MELYNTIISHNITRSAHPGNVIYENSNILNCRQYIYEQINHIAFRFPVVGATENFFLRNIFQYY